MAGTIRVMVPQLMAEHKPPLNKVQLAKLIGCSRPTATLLAQGKWARLSQKQTEAMCDLFKLDIGEIFVYQPDVVAA